MNKDKQYVKKVEGILNKVNFEELNQEPKKELLKNEFHKAFLEIYRKESIEASDCVKNEGFAFIPALIKDSECREYVGLLDVCVQDSGELYGVTVVTTDGVKTQNESGDFNNFITFPYQYKPLIEIIGDIHTSAYY